MEDASQLINAAAQDVEAATSPDGLEEVRIKYLGRRGSLTLAMRELGGLDPEARRRAGAELNAAKDQITAALAEAASRLGRAALEQRLASERVDVTLPVTFAGEGRIHPISQTIDEIVAIFGEMGFVVAEGPHIEEDFYNFTALNIPPEHPARQEHDTFYLPERADGTRLVLRTHTSPVQIRTMLAQQPPIRIIVPGRTFRCDHDATHSPMFHQVEGLVIDRTTHMGHLKGCLIEFCRAFFGIDDLPVRFRPSYFPFTEPSAEVDIGCSRKGGGSKIGAGGDWLEILGCGMVHPESAGELRHRPRRVSGLRLRHGDRADRDAEIRHPRSAHVLRFAICAGCAITAFCRSTFPRWCAARSAEVLRHEDDPRLAQDPSRYRCAARLRSSSV